MKHFPTLLALGTYEALKEPAWLRPCFTAKHFLTGGQRFKGVLDARVLVSLGAAFFLSPRPQVLVGDGEQRLSRFLHKHWLETTPYLSRKERLGVGIATVLLVIWFLFLVLGLPTSLLGLGLSPLCPEGRNFARRLTPLPGFFVPLVS